MTNYLSAFTDYAVASRAAVQFNHPDLTNSAITRERYRRLQDARAALVQAGERIRAQSTAPDPEAAISEVFASLATTDADSVAVANNEWAKVRAMLDAGRSLGPIIENADRRRLSAILDHLDSDLALQTDDPEGVSAEVSQAVLSRLAGLGDPKAAEAIAAQEGGRYASAWQRLIGEASVGAVSVDARSALFRANQDEYQVAFNDEDLEAAEFELKIAHLDRLAPTLAEATRG